jgi:hypothetical protein
MKATITNTSRALQGVHSVDGLVFIDAGQSRPVDVADDYVDRVKALPFLDAVWDNSAPDPATDKPAGGVSTRPKGKAPAKRKAKPAAAAAQKAAAPKAFDAMSDTELKTFLTDKGVTLTDETREQLVELAKAA